MDIDAVGAAERAEVDPLERAGVDGDSADVAGEAEAVAGGRQIEGLTRIAGVEPDVGWRAT